MDSCSTGTSASGYMTLSGTHAPWSRPRLGCWCAGALSGISEATSRANADASVDDRSALELFLDQGAHLPVIMKAGKFHKNELK